MTKPKVTTDARGHIHIRLDAGVAATVSRGISQRSIDSRSKMAKAAKDAGDVKIVYNKLLGGWYVVRGPQQTPLSGKFASKLEAEQWLRSRGSAKDAKGKPCGCKH